MRETLARVVALHWFRYAELLWTFSADTCLPGGDYVDIQLYQATEHGISQTQLNGCFEDVKVLRKVAPGQTVFEYAHYERGVPQYRQLDTVFLQPLESKTIEISL